MSIENIHDALGFLDDDMIEEVDKLRNDVKEQKKWTSKMKVIWMRWISVAACLCIIAVGVYVLDNVGVLQLGVMSKDMASEESTKESSSNINQEADIEDAADTEIKKENTDSLLVEIKAWQEDGFTGTISNNGKEVVVKTNDTMKSSDFPVGSLVYVQFYSQESKIESGTESCTQIDDNYTSGEQIVIYAESIELVENE